MKDKNLEFNPKTIVRKIEPEYVDRSLGFDVTIRNAPMRKVWDAWVLALNKKSFHHAVLVQLTLGKGDFSGKQIRFVRQWLKESTTVFGDRFGVTHVSVLNWEKGTHAPSVSALVHIKLAIVRSLPEELVGQLFDGIFDLSESLEAPKAPPASMEILAKIIEEKNYRELRLGA